MITFKEICKLANVKESTGRSYRDRFVDHFPAQGEGRSRRYSLESVKVLMLISEGYTKGLEYEQVRESLEQRYGVLVVQEESNSVTTTQLEVIEAIRSVFQQEITRLEGKIDDMGERHDKLLMESIRLIQAKQPNKWWSILLGK
jgi:DNA-binding transcriptional MerR regulator